MQKKYFTSQDARSLINSYGLSIFPVHGIVDGLCTCGDANCTNKGKHPATPNGFKDATNNIDNLLTIWAARKHLNVGIATGEKSKIFVIDIDSAEGERNFSALGPCPATLSVTTGKGRHLYFNWPGEHVITKRGILPGVDVRGDGGYVCGPGSNHISGSTYEWINPLEVIQDAPEHILCMVIKSRIKNAPQDLPANLNLMPAKRINLMGGWTPDDIQAHLSHISPDIGYDDWIAVGMALQSEGVSFDVWDSWSANGTKYKGSKDTAQHWKSFKPNAGTTYGTVVHMAKQGGWQPSTRKVDTLSTLTNKIKIEPKTAGAKEPETTLVTQQVIENKETRRGRKLPLIYASDVTPITDTADFVENFLCENQFSVIYGESNCGKTFFMLDLAMHVALGRPWRGRAVDGGGVIYAALEGGFNTQNRIVAFKNHYQVTQDIPLAIIPSSMNLLDPDGDIKSLIDAIWEAKERIGNIKLVIIDTLSRAMHGGDENASTDMGQLIINIDAIRQITGAHISFVHHCGKDALKGARGHSSLRAAVDTEIEISREAPEKPSKIKIVKQREMEMGEDMFFALKSIELGHNQRLKPVTSCVIIEAQEDTSNRSIKMTPVQTFIYDSLVHAILNSGQMRVMFTGNPAVNSVTYDELREVMEDRGYKELMETEKKSSAEQVKSATQTARMALKKAGKINFNKKYIWIESDINILTN